MHQRISSREFTEWVAYSRVEPFGWEMENWRVGLICSQLINAINRTIPRQPGTGKPKQLKPQDFYPAVKPAGSDLTPEQAAFIKDKRGKRRHSNHRLRSRDGEVHSRT